MSGIHEYSVPVTLEEFDFPKTVEAGQSFRWNKIAPKTWIGADGDDFYQVEVHMSILQVSSNAPESSFRSLFRMHESIQDIGREITGICPELAPALKSARGLRLMQHSCKREVLFSFLCSSMNNIPRIRGMVAYLASSSQDACGPFPSLERLAELSEQDLRANGFGYRAPYVLEVARQILHNGGETFLDSLGSQTYDQAHESLTKLRGIGPKVADCILLLAYGRGEAFPIDSHVLQAVARHHNPKWRNGSLTPKKYIEIGNYYRKKFGNLAGYAQHLLFFENRNRSKQ